MMAKLDRLSAGWYWLLAGAGQDRVGRHGYEFHAARAGQLFGR